MKKEHHRRQRVKSKTFSSPDERTAYWKGYMRGLRLAYHGKKFESREEHRKRMELINDSDEVKRDMDKGYRDGIKDK
jgi:hypothetical protein